MDYIEEYTDDDFDKDKYVLPTNTEMDKIMPVKKEIERFSQL